MWGQPPPAVLRAKLEWFSPPSSAPLRRRLPVSQPDNEVGQRRRSAQFPQASRILSPVIVAVHGRLRQRMTPAELDRRCEPRRLDEFLQFGRIQPLQQFPRCRMVTPRILLQVPHAGKVFQFLECELRRSRSGDPQEGVLHLVNVQQPFADRLVGQRRRMRLKRAPVLGIGPFLMCIEFVKIRAHSDSSLRSVPVSLLRLACSGAV